MAAELEARDLIRLCELKIRTIIGVNPAERTVAQEIVINLALRLDLKAACLSDDLADTVDYHTLEQQIIEYTTTTTFFLLERLADGICRLCLEQALVQEVCCRVDKPAAPLRAKAVSVEINRRRQDYE